MGKTLSKLEKKGANLLEEMTRGVGNAFPQVLDLSSHAHSGIPGLPARFSYRQLELATSYFSDVIGVGGFATVYRGRLLTGEEVAVKKLKVGAGNQLEDQDFQAEMFSGSANHRSMMRLLGFCTEGQHRILVYEYMPNGSLDRWIFSEPQDYRRLLSWDTRVRIALGVAKALDYLHDGSREQILHFDIKPQNILLDALLEPKLADFGAAKLRNRMYENHSLDLGRVMFTRGYVAPEVLLNVGVTQKSDVYSYGLVLLELISGRANRVESVDSPEKRYFPAWAQHCLQQFEAPAGDPDKLLHELVDWRLDGKFNKQEAFTGLKTGLWCIQRDPEQRPSMADAIRMLQGHVKVPTPPENVGFTAVVDDTLNRSSTAHFNPTMRQYNFYTNTAVESAEIQSLYGSSVRLL